MNESVLIENIFNEGLSLREITDIVMGLNSSANRHLKSSLAFSFFVSTPTEQTVELSNGKRHYHISILLRLGH